MVVVWCLAVRFGCLLGPDRWWRLGVGGEWIGYFLFVCFSNSVILIATAASFYCFVLAGFCVVVGFYDLVSLHVCYHCTQRSIHGRSSLGWLLVGFLWKSSSLMEPLFRLLIYLDFTFPSPTWCILYLQINPIHSTQITVSPLLKKAHYLVWVLSIRVSCIFQKRLLTSPQGPQQSRRVTRANPLNLQTC